jgi:hypothetical protein
LYGGRMRTARYTLLSPVMRAAFSSSASTSGLRSPKQTGQFLQQMSRHLQCQRIHRVRNKDLRMTLPCRTVIRLYATAFQVNLVQGVGRSTAGSRSERDTAAVETRRHPLLQQSSAGVIGSSCLGSHC